VSRPSCVVLPVYAGLFAGSHHALTTSCIAKQMLMIETCLKGSHDQIKHCGWSLAS
jgi:hypothetical protein